MTEKQLKTLINELSPFLRINNTSDAIWAFGKNNTYLAYYKREVSSYITPGLYIAKFINDNKEVVYENGELFLGLWSEELKVNLDDDDEIRRRVYNIIKRMKEIKNKERMKKIQEDF